MKEDKSTAEHVADDVPEAPSPNIFPIEWRIDTPKLEEIFSVYIKGQWNPFDIRWHELSSKDYDDREKIAMAYWWAKLATFEFSLGPFLAKLLVQGFEQHLQDPVKKLTGAFVMDEMRHDQCCKMACNALCPGFPWRYKARNDLERRAVRNIKWIYYNAGRYWRAFSNAIGKYPLSVLYVPPTVGEQISIHTFGEGSRRAKHPVFSQFFSNITRDETRHYAFLRTGLEYFASSASDETKRIMTKQFRDAFVLLSIHFYEPVLTRFWKLPSNFMETHQKLEEIAMDSDLGVLPIELRRKLWQETFARFRDDFGPLGIEMPEIPEI